MDDTTEYVLYWQDKGNPNHYGEASKVRGTNAAKSICKTADQLFPKFRHWYEKPVTEEQ